jgi:hypothetical protein
MAQAKAGASAQRSRSTRQKKSSNRSRGSSTRKNTKRTASKPQASTRKRQAPSKPRVATVVESTAKDAGKTAKDASKTVGRAAKKAKVPLLAGGAALAAAGGIALGAHQARRHKGLGIGKTLGKVDADDIANAAKRVGDVGAQIGQVASELQRARNGANGKRSPVEVVLEGLTARRV